MRRARQARHGVAGGVFTALVVLAVGACAPAGSPETGPVPNSGSATGPADAVDIVVDATAPGRPIDRRLLGTNVPAWLGPEALASNWLRSAIAELGVRLVRMPGGSWSNGYGWSACEQRQPVGCIWTGAARPADFADLLAGTGVEGMWTVSINETAQSAAALVSYFNAELDDDTVIGVDRNGEDWGAAGRWAELRAQAGHPEPVRIALWEIGNEVFGGRPESGDDCVDGGWEEVWTCDGTDYVLGDASHDGYLDIRRAMLEIDPTILVGAVGVADPSSWSNWGNEVVDAARGAIDFYVVHEYPFDRSPAPQEAAIAAAVWPRVVSGARTALPRDVAIAVTEYNLVSTLDADTAGSMVSAANAFFVADTIGRLAELGVGIANQWNLANGTAGNGADYGLVDAGGRGPFPQSEGFAVWGRAGDDLLPFESPAAALPQGLRVYPTRFHDGSIDVILLNLDDSDHTVTIRIDGAGRTGTLVSVAADDPAATEMHSVPPVSVSAAGGSAFEVRLPAWSISELRVDGRP